MTTAIDTGAPAPETPFAQDPTEPGFVQDPYPAYARMRALGRAPIWTDAPYGFPVLHRYADVDGVLRDRRFGRDPIDAGAPGAEDAPPHLAPFRAFERRSLLEREPPAHTRLRRLVNKAFVSRAVERWRPRIRALAAERVAALEAARAAAGGGAVDLLSLFCEPIPVEIITELVGAPRAAAPKMRAWSNAMVAIYQANRTRAIEDACVRALTEFSSFMDTVIEERRAAPDDDLMSALIAAEEDGDRLSRDELITTCVLLMNAGHEASVHALGNGVKAVLESGRDARAVFADATAAARAAEEILRFDPPLHLFTRYAREDVSLLGKDIRRGETIGLLLGAANRDPDRFREPDRFDPARADAAHVSFGAGLHFCVGAPLARAEIEESLAVLFERLPTLRIAEPPRYADRYHFHGLDALMVAW